MENIFPIENVFYGMGVTRASVVLFNKAATNSFHITLELHNDEDAFSIQDAPN